MSQHIFRAHCLQIMGFSNYEVGDYWTYNLINHEKIFACSAFQIKFVVVLWCKRDARPDE